jgi:large subunit ribosomal protein L23
MSILNRFKKPKEEEKKKQPKKEKVVLPKPETEKKVEEKKKLPEMISATTVLNAPHISEKATFLQRENKYVFRVSKRTNKIEVKKAIENLYKVKVENVNIVNIPAKKKMWRGRPGYESGHKKAIVTIEKGQKIEIAL